MDKTACLEEQAAELEALESIFGDDFRRVANDGCELILRPVTSGSSKQNHILVAVTIQFPPMYPTVVPDLTFRCIKGRLSDEQLNELAQLAHKAAAASVGSIMIFEVTESLREWLVQNNKKEVVSLRDDLQAAIELQEAEMRAQAEAAAAAQAEADRLRGDELSDDEYDLDEGSYENESTIVIPPNTIVTDESFLEWNRQFLEEQGMFRGASPLLDSPLGIEAIQHLILQSLQRTPSNISPAPPLLFQHHTTQNNVDLPNWQLKASTRSRKGRRASKSSSRT